MIILKLLPKNNQEISLKLRYIMPLSKNIEISLLIEDFSKLNMGIVEGNEVEIHLVDGVLTNKLSVSLETSVVDRQLVRVLRGDKIFYTRIKIGKVGLEYFEIINDDLYEGDYIVFDW
ncbi:MAG TPA: hypothetical protein PLT15_03705 [Bacilli bacterium]|nr:hypothetical protein [Bacilli bacterium]